MDVLPAQLAARQRSNSDAPVLAKVRMRYSRCESNRVPHTYVLVLVGCTDLGYVLSGCLHHPADLRPSIQSVRGSDNIRREEEEEQDVRRERQEGNGI